MQYHIYQEPKNSTPGELWIDTGEVYDDTNGPVEDHLESLHQSTGVCHSAATIL